jgi:hypothetical protein
MGQNHHHTAALLQSSTTPQQQQQQQQFAHARRKLQQELLLKAQQGTLRPSRAGGEVLQSFSSNTSSIQASSSSSTPRGLHALPRLQPMNSSASSYGAPLSTSNSSSSEEGLLPGFSGELYSESAGCMPTFAGDQACLGMLLGTSFGR